MDDNLVQRVRRRADFSCEYCRLPETYSPLAFEIDHIIARKHRGATVVANLAFACFACNNHKGPNIAGIDPASGNVTRLFHPRRHKWSRHFRWDGPILVGRTPIGRVTITVLEINLPYRVAFRRSLMKESVFPPE